MPTNPRDIVAFDQKVSILHDTQVIHSYRKIYSYEVNCISNQRFSELNQGHRIEDDCPTNQEKIDEPQTGVARVFCHGPISSVNI